jgi:hypothetical protein
MPEDTGVAQLLAERRAAREAEVAARAAAPPKSAKDYFASGLTPNDMNELQLFNQKPLSPEEFYSRPNQITEDDIAIARMEAEAPREYTLDNAWQRYKDMVHNSRMAVQDYAKRFVAAPVDTVKQTAVDAATGVYDTVTYPGRLLQGDIPYVIDPVTGRVSPEGQNQFVVNALGMMGGAGSIASPPGGLGSFFGKGSLRPQQLDLAHAREQMRLNGIMSDPNSTTDEILAAYNQRNKMGLYAKGGKNAFDVAEQNPDMSPDELYKATGVTRLPEGTLLGEISDKGAGWKPDFVKKLVVDNSPPKILIPDYATAAVQQLNDIYVRDGNLDSVRFRDSKPKSDITQTYNLSDEEFLRKVRVDPLLLVGTRVQLDKPDILKRLGGYGHEDVEDIMDISPDELPQALQEKYALGELSPIDGTVITKAEYDRAVEDYVVKNFKKDYNANPKSYGDYAVQLARIKDDPGAYLDVWGKPSDVLKSIGGTGKEYLNENRSRRGNDIVAVLDNSKESKLREEFSKKGMPATKLGDMYNHPELFKAYPELENIKVEIEGSETPSPPDLPDRNGRKTYSAYWDTVTNKIVFANASSAKDFFSNPYKAGSMIHELDHAISELESKAGFIKPKGANSTRFKKTPLDFVRLRLNILRDETDIAALQNLPQLGAKELSEIKFLQGRIKDAKKETVRAGDEGEVGYMSSLGEFTARLADMRKNMSAEELASNPPPVIPFGSGVIPEAVSSQSYSDLSGISSLTFPDVPKSIFNTREDYLKTIPREGN